MPQTDYVDGNLVANITSNGEKTMPLQSAFLAYLGSTDSNVTGNGTTYTLGTNVAFTEVFDQNADLALNPVTFTAPVTGRYFFEFCLEISDLNGSNNSSIRIVTSNGTYGGANTNPTNVANAVNGAIALDMCLICDMDAADTATFAVVDYNAGADNNDITTTLRRTRVSGALIC